MSESARLRPASRATVSQALRTHIDPVSDVALLDH
jgi:hypothetical protein